jgi:hypothetical protein
MSKKELKREKGTAFNFNNHKPLNGFKIFAQNNYLL